MSDESVGLSGYCCERKDRVGRAGGGVACYVAATVPYDRLLDIDPIHAAAMTDKKRGLGDRFTANLRVST